MKIVNISPGFRDWIASVGSLAISSYRHHRLFMIGSDLELFQRDLETPTGVAFDGERLAVATLTQLVTYVKETTEEYDGLFVPQIGHYTAALSIHDVAFDCYGGIVFANTAFSCLSRVSETYSFEPIWKPSFISALAAQDRCHLNGLAMHNGEPAYVTAFGATDTSGGWRNGSGGIVIDVQSNEIACDGLYKPHSPRLHGGKLWLLQSGRLGYIDATFRSIAAVPGFARGLSFAGHYAIVGASRMRGEGEGLPGVYVINTQTGVVEHWIHLDCDELYDVVVLPGIRKPALIGFRSGEIRDAVSVPPDRSVFEEIKKELV